MTTSAEKGLSLTSEGVLFDLWATDVANDDLTFVSLRHWGSDWVDYPTLGFGLALIDPLAKPHYDLEAVFLSRDKKAAVRFEFQSVRAFRVLDEGGLGELWKASAQKPRPAQTTFKVKGHGWQAESDLEWFMGSGPGHFSYMVATGSECLEVICSKEPGVEISPAIIRTLE